MEVDLTDCIPLERQRVSKALGAGNLSPSNARTMCRRKCHKIHGPPPEDGMIVRHLCENDSTMPNGFICIHPDHIKWDTQSNNMLDEYSEKGRRSKERQREILRAVCSEGGKSGRGKKKGPGPKKTEQWKKEQSERIRLWWAQRKSS